MDLITLATEVQQAGVVIPLAIIAIGAALLAFYLFKPKSPDAIKDDRPTTATLRGSYIPVVMGMRRVGPVVGFVGSRTTTEESVDNPGGKGGGGGGETKVTIYHERAIHYLCVGPAARIHTIYVDGVCVENSYMDRILNPSDTTVDLGETGSLKIYWGEDDQSGNAWVKDKLGINTNLPRVCRVDWDRKRLGQNPRWPLIEYDVEVRPQGANPLTGAAWLDDGSFEGINPAYAMYQILTAPYPYGIGMPISWIDFTALNTVSTVCESEHIPMNILISEGDTAEKVIASIMQTIGAIMPECCGKLAPYMIRKISGTAESLDNDMLLPPFDEIENLHEEQRFDRLVYEYPDRSKNFKPATIDIDYDGQADFNQRKKTRKIPIPNVTGRRVASKVADRRQLEDLVPALRIRAKGVRNLRNATPGQKFDLPGIGAVRLLGLRYGPDSPEVMLDLYRDFYSQDPTDFVDPDLPGDDVNTLAEDLSWRFIEIPYAANPSVLSVLCARHRANGGITAGRQWISTDDTTYAEVQTQSPSHLAGILEEDWVPIGGQIILETGPLIRLHSEDEVSEKTLDLSGDEQAWRRGDQMLILGDEIFFVREVVAEGDHWRCKGLIRAQYDSKPLLEGIPDPQEPNATFVRAATTLSTAITTTYANEIIDCAATDAFAASGRVIIDDEILSYGLNSTSSDILSDTERAQNGSTGATHSVSAAVTEVVEAFLVMKSGIVPLQNDLIVRDVIRYYKNQACNGGGCRDLTETEARTLTVVGRGLAPNVAWYSYGGCGTEEGRSLPDGKGVLKRDLMFSTSTEDLLVEFTPCVENGSGVGALTPWNVAGGSGGADAQFEISLQFNDQTGDQTLPPNSSAPEDAVWVEILNDLITISGLADGTWAGGTPGVQAGLAVVGTAIGGDLGDEVFPTPGTFYLYIDEEAYHDTELQLDQGDGPPNWIEDTQVDWRIGIRQVASDGKRGAWSYVYPSASRSKTPGGGA